MEGPTPVSALIHAATMVTAGIFLVIRLNRIFELSLIVLQLMVIVGALTAFFAATVALFQSDMKKSIAYSTCSQLGYMLVACGLSKYGLAFFHLFTHGFFKALLFLAAGALLHGLDDEQDQDEMADVDDGYLYFITSIGGAALCATPFFSGYYSKEIIIQNTIFVENFFSLGLFAFFLLILTAVLTNLYSSRTMETAFCNESETPFDYHVSGFLINVSLFFLMCLSVCVGFFFCDYFIFFGNNFNSDTVSVALENELSNFALYFFSGLFVISFLTSVDVNDAAEEYFATVFDDFFMLKYKNFYMHVEDFFVDG